MPRQICCAPTWCYAPVPRRWSISRLPKRSARPKVRWVAASACYGSSDLAMPQIQPRSLPISWSRPMRRLVLFASWVRPAPTMKLASMATPATTRSHGMIDHYRPMQRRRRIRRYAKANAGWRGSMCCCWRTRPVKMSGSTSRSQRPVVIPPIRKVMSISSRGCSATAMRLLAMSGSNLASGFMSSTAMRCGILVSHSTSTTGWPPRTMSNAATRRSSVVAKATARSGRTGVMPAARLRSARSSRRSLAKGRAIHACSRSMPAGRSTPPAIMPMCSTGWRQTTGHQKTISMLSAPLHTSTTIRSNPREHPPRPCPM